MSRKKRCHLPASAMFNNSWLGFGSVIEDRGHLDSTQGMRVTPLKTTTVLPPMSSYVRHVHWENGLPNPISSGTFFGLFKEMIKNHRRMCSSSTQEIQAKKKHLLGGEPPGHPIPGKREVHFYILRLFRLGKIL